MYNLKRAHIFSLSMPFRKKFRLAPLGTIPPTKWLTYGHFQFIKKMFLVFVFFHSNIFDNFTI